MKTSSTLLTGAILLLSFLPTSPAAVIKKPLKRSNCTFNSDPDCLPNYNNDQINATFDDLKQLSNIVLYNGLSYTGFKAFKQPLDKPALIPTSGRFTARSKNSSAVPDSTQIGLDSASNAVILKFKSFVFGCAEFDNATPVACCLNVTGYNPIGDHPKAAGTVTFEYHPLPYPRSGMASMMTISEQQLQDLRVANYFVFTTYPLAESVGAIPRLTLDDVNAVTYAQL